MTSNQIARQQLLEDQRANRAKERENYRSNKAKEEENYRSNVAKEQENVRHNKESEYSALIGATKNPFSLMSHFAGGAGDAGEGTENILKSFWPIKKTRTTKDPSRR